MEVQEIQRGIKEIADSIILLDRKITESEEKYLKRISEVEKRIEEYEKKFALYNKYGWEDKTLFYETIGRAIQTLYLEKRNNFTVYLVQDGKLTPEMRAVITPADLANLVEPQFIHEVYQVASKFGLARQLLTVFPVTSNSLRTNKADGYVSVYWRSKQTPPQTRETTIPSIQGITVNLEWLDALVVISKDATRFTSFALGNYVVEKLGEGFAKYEDYVALQGVALNDIYDGLTTIAGNVYSLASGKTSYYNATADDFRKAINSLELRFREGAVWIMHPTVLSVVELLKDAQGNYIYRKPGDAEGPGRLWGYPVYLSEQMPSTDGAGKIFAFFGNPKHSRLYVYQEPTFDITDQATVTLADNTTVNLWQRDAFAVRGSEMIAFSHFFPQAYVVMKTASV